MAYDVIFNELKSLEDEYLLPWLDLYETAFPPHERFLVSRILSSLTSKETEYPNYETLLAVINPEGKFIGLVMLLYLVDKKIGLLWYLAVCPDERSKGYGAKIYQKIMDELRSLQFKALMFEVEMPELVKMIHPLQPMEPNTAFGLVKSVFEDAVQQTGSIQLD
jgi:GNAT superfamily N-acetyltransferase